jgi:hypothetical protein
MKFVVYGGMSDAYNRTFDDGKFVYLKRFVVTGVSDEILSILKDTMKKNRIVEVISLDNNTKKILGK